MRVQRIALSFLIVLPLFAAKERQQFSSREPLTAARTGAPRDIAGEYMRSTAATIGLDGADLAGLYIAKEYQSAHNGVTHFVYKQQFQGIDVYNAEWVVNVDRDGRVLNAGGFLYRRPADGLGPAAISNGARSEERRVGKA